MPTSSFVTVAVAVSVVMSTSGASAAQPQEMRDLRTALASDTVSPVVRIEPSKPTSASYNAADGVVTAPTRRPSVFMSMTTPGQGAGDMSGWQEALNVLRPRSPHYTTAVLTTSGGAFRGLIYIKSRDAPTEYAFDLTVPTGARLTKRTDGGMDVRGSDGYVLGSFAAPWAVDAAGAPVATRYSLRGATLVQHVSFTGASAFPIVADPFWIPALFVMARLSSHALQQAARRKISQDLIRQVVENGRRTAGHSDRSVFTQGKGASRIRVIVQNRTGEIVTVTRG